MEQPTLEDAKEHKDIAELYNELKGRSYAYCAFYAVTGIAGAGLIYQQVHTQYESLLEKAVTYGLRVAGAVLLVNGLVGLVRNVRSSVRCDRKINNHLTCAENYSKKQEQK